MIYISETYALAIAIFDLTITITSLLFRKPKRKFVTSTPDRKLSKRVGYYLIGSSVVVLLLGHYAFYASLANYLEGLFLDAFFFYFGLRTVTQHE